MSVLMFFAEFDS